MAGERILIVDDNVQNLKLARVILSGEGFDVRTANDAEEALRMLSAFGPRLILMDLQLPGMDGLQLTRQLKENPRTRHISVVALTAYAMKGDAEKAYAAGCDGYVTKPLDVDDLPKIIRSHLVAGT